MSARTMIVGPGPLAKRPTTPWPPKSGVTANPTAVSSFAIRAADCTSKSDSSGFSCRCRYSLTRSGDSAAMRASTAARCGFAGDWPGAGAVTNATASRVKKWRMGDGSRRRGAGQPLIVGEDRGRCNRVDPPSAHAPTGSPWIC